MCGFVSDGERAGDTVGRAAGDTDGSGVMTVVGETAVVTGSGVAVGDVDEPGVGDSVGDAAGDVGRGKAEGLAVQKVGLPSGLPWALR